jgi:hypothetical protein
VFNHRNIQTYRFEDIPLDRDLSLMDLKWMDEYEAALVASVSETGDSAYTVGYYSHAAARAIGTDFIDLSWYPNTFDRFHEVSITLPRSAFVTCVGRHRQLSGPRTQRDTRTETNMPAAMPSRQRRRSRSRPETLEFGPAGIGPREDGPGGG